MLLYVQIFIKCLILIIAPLPLLFLVFHLGGFNPGHIQLIINIHVLSCEATHADV